MSFFSSGLQRGKVFAVGAMALSVALIIPFQTPNVGATESSSTSSVGIERARIDQDPNVPLDTTLNNLPSAKNSEERLQPMTTQMLRLVESVFPYYKTEGVIGGYREDPFPDHPSGQALDIMIRGGAHDATDALGGDQIAAFLMVNAQELGIKYMAWRQHIWYPGREWRLMNDRSDWTHNHMDHVHVLVNGSHTPAGVLVMPEDIVGIDKLPTPAMLERARTLRISQLKKALAASKKTLKVSNRNLVKIEKKYGLSSKVVRSSTRQVDSLARETYMFGADLDMVSNAVGWLGDPHALELGQKVNEREHTVREQRLASAKKKLKIAQQKVSQARDTRDKDKLNFDQLSDQLNNAQASWAGAES